MLTRGIQPHIFSIRESNGIQAMTIEYFHKNDPKLKADIERIVTEMRDAKEYGSILNITPVDFAGLYARFDEIREDINMMQMSALDELLPLVKCAELLAQKYDVVVTNPPYMAVSNAGAKVNDYVKKNFPDSKADLFAVFIERCGQMAKKNGYQAMITQHAWMFLSSFEKLRTKLLAVDIVNMAHLGARAFEEIGGEVVQTTSFVIRKSHIADYKGEYCRLIEPTSQQGKEDMFLTGENRYAADQSNFSKIPGSPVAYWVSQHAFDICTGSQVFEDFATTRAGMITGNNNMFIRLWHEVSWGKVGILLRSRSEAISSKKKWFPYNKGGEYRKWYGNNDYVVNWENDGSYMRNFKDSSGKIPAHAFNLEYIFKENVTWSSLSSYKFAARYTDYGFLYDASGSFADVQAENIFFTLAFLCSEVTLFFLGAMNPTLNFQKGNISSLPFIIDVSRIDQVSGTTKENVEISKGDWDSYETSWDFKRNPLV